jgi:hypothetical protein
MHLRVTGEYITKDKLDAMLTSWEMRNQKPAPHIRRVKTGYRAVRFAVMVWDSSGESREIASFSSWPAAVSHLIYAGILDECTAKCA